MNTASAIPDELSTKRILSLINEGKELGCTEFTLIGGEPFINRDWPLIVGECGHDSTVNITTNGHYFDETTLNTLAGLPQVRELRVSLDGLSSHDLIRQGSSHEMVLSAIANCTENLPDCRIVVQTTCNQRNLPELLPLYHRLRNLGIFRWRISQLWRYGRTKENEGLVEFADYNKMFSAYRELITRFHEDSKPFRLGIYNVYNSQITAEDYVEMSLDTHPCLYHFESLCIKANGEMTFCPALDLPFASVKTQPILFALQTSWLKEFMSMTTRSVSCGNCRYIKLCGGGCRADAYAWLGDIRSLDPISCCLMTRVERDIVPILATDEQIRYHSLINTDGDMPPASGRNAIEAVETVARLKEGVEFNGTEVP